MDAKLNHSDLSALLAKEAGMSLVKAELLTKTVFDLIIEGLEQDGIVKINGLGTFKLTEVASRSSVNVNTGEKFEIKGHKKLVFTPADSLKDSVNQPFAMFEPVEVDETYCDESDEENSDFVAEENCTADEARVEADDVVLLSGEEKAVVEENVAYETVVEEVEAEPETDAEEKNEKVLPEENVEVVEEPVEEQVEPQVEVKVEQPIEPAVEQPKRPEPVMVHVAKKEKKQFVDKEKKEKKSHKGLYVALSVVFSLITISAVIYVLYITPEKETAIAVSTGTVVLSDTVTDKYVPAVNEYITDTIEGVTVDAVTEATIVDATSGATPQDKELVSNEKPIDTLVQEVSEPEEYKFVITEELASLDLRNITLADTVMYYADGDLAEHKVVAHETLTRISLKYYGDKKLWPYIVRYNSLSRPDDLSKGMKILIPKLKPIN